MISDNKNKLSGYLVYIFYAVAMIALVIYAWNEQSEAAQGGNSPLYRNIRECPAYVKKGFDVSDLLQIPDESGEWRRFQSRRLRILDSPLELPKRKFLSPRGNDPQEFTVNILLEMDGGAIAFLDGNISIVPGLFIAGIGENWEIFFNGKLVRAEMYPDETGRIVKPRTWYNVYFPLDRSLVIPGTNILTLRILGDPSFLGTGVFFQKAPVYMDDYKVIEERQFNFLDTVFCAIFAFTGIYYLMLYFSVKSKTEIFNLYFGIFSILLFIYIVSRQKWIYSMIPNSSITTRFEYGSIMLAIPILGIFFETLGMRKISKVSLGYLTFCFLLCLTQAFFCNQYGEDVIMIWDITAFLYFSYILVYYIIYFLFWEKRRKKIQDENDGEASELHIGGVLIGMVISYLCGLFDVLDAVFFSTSIRLFTYSIFAIHIGMVFILSQRFSEMYKRLEQSNAILEIAVHERTQELEKQIMIALQASTAKSDFLAKMSHEIRTPMNAINGMTELLLRGELSGEARGYAQDIKQAGNNLVSIINDILDFSKIEAGKLEIIPVNYLLSSLLNDTVNIIRMRLMEKPLRFFTNIDGNIPNSLIGDEVRLRQILLNLLSNAIKYSEIGHIGLTVTADKRDDKQVWLKITVTDTGRGIRNEDQGKLFDEFVKVDVKKNQGIEGTGLGLAITKRLCEAMGGEISMESEYGKGSVFTALIPQGIGSTEPFAAVEEPEKKKVLVYEGRAVYAKAVCWTLENMKVPNTMVTNQDDFAEALYREEWFYVFSSYGLYEKIKPHMEQDAALFRGGKKPSLALMIEWGTEAYIQGVRFVSIPAQSLSIANVLNGKEDSKGYIKSSGVIRFTFPQARLLVVDDIATNLKVVEGLLAPYKAAVDTCLNGRQAIELAKQNEYDIIFMDHMMPEMDGIETTAIIRAWEKEQQEKNGGNLRKQIPIIALTANAVLGMREMFIENGFNDFLSKPIDVSKLDEILDRWIMKEKREGKGKREEGSGRKEEGVLMSIPGVDTAKGVAMTGGTVAAYRQVLSLFCKDAEDRLPVLQEASEADLSALVTHVHALKSASASIGAGEVSALAAELETAGKDGDMASVKGHLPAFTRQLTELIENIRSALRHDENTDTVSIANFPIANSSLFNELAQAVKKQNAADIDRIIAALGEKRLDAQTRGALEKISNDVLMAEFENALKTIEEVLRT